MSLAYEKNPEKVAENTQEKAVVTDL